MLKYTLYVIYKCLNVININYVTKRKKQRIVTKLKLIEHL